MSAEFKTVGPVVEVASEVIFEQSNLTYHPDGYYGSHEIQCDTLGGGTVEVFVWGPAELWGSVGTGSEGDIILVGRAPRIRVVFTGTGGAGRAFIRSRLSGAV